MGRNRQCAGDHRQDGARRLGFRGPAPRQTLVLLAVLSALAPLQSIAQIPPVALRTPLQFTRAFEGGSIPVGIHAIAGDAEGFLRLGADSGLYRFDGIHAHLISPKPIRHIKAAPAGWILAGGSGGLFAWRRGEVRTLLTAPVTGLAIRGETILASSGGTVWSGSLSGLLNTGFLTNGMLTADGRGDIWFGCGRGICSLGEATQLHRFGRAEGIPEKPWVGAIGDEEGALLAFAAGVALRVTGGRAYDISGPVATDPPVDIYRARDGRIWVGGERWFDHGHSYSGFPESGRMGEMVFGQDSSGNLWAANNTGQLVELAPRHWISSWSNWLHSTNTEGMTRGCESVTRSRSGSLFASCRDGLFELDPANQIPDPDHSWHLRPSPFGEADVISVADADPTGPGRDLWVAYRSHGIARVGPDSRIKTVARAQPSDVHDFRAFLRDATGKLWVGSKGGVFRLDESTGALTQAHLEGGDYAVAFATGPDGRQWLGYEGGIARLDGNQFDGNPWKREIPVGLLADPGVGSLAAIPGPAFWVSYRYQTPFGRLSFENGKWQRRDFPAAAGYGPIETRCLLVDRRGWIWRGTKEGLFVADGRHLAPQDWLRFGTIHNLPEDSVSPFGLFEDTDGTIWVSTGGGVAQIQPDPAWFVPLPAKPIRLTRARWQGKENLISLETEKLEPGSGNLELDFAQWPDALPRPRELEYRLLPFENNWHSTLNGTARYESLPAGNYRFEVRDRYGSARTFAVRTAQTMPLTWLWWLGPASFLPVGYWFLQRRKQACYWREKAEFLALHEDDDGGIERAGTLLAGRYRIDTEIGKGGFARVWKAFDLESGAAVAIKFLTVAGEIEEWQRARFEKETDALRRIDHPGIVRLLGSGWDQISGPWLALTWIDGPDLRAVLKSGPVPRAKAAAWIVQIGEALAEAHSQGVLHRDLKPENILIEFPGAENERVMIVDFGAATIPDASRDNRSALFLGSLDYLAPERLAGMSSPATDVYALAAVVFEMLTGVRYRSLADGSEAALRRNLPGFPAELARLLAAGLAYAPGQRPTGIGLYAGDLARAIRTR